MIYDNNTTTGNDTLQIYTTTTPGNTIGNAINNTLTDDDDGNGALWSIIGIVLLIAIIIAIVIGATKDKDEDQNKNRK